MKISVAHPGKQHVFELIKGLVKENLFYRFYTSFTFGYNSPLSKVGKLKKRINPVVPDSLIRKFPIFQLANTFLKLPLEVGRFYQYTWFDKWVARCIGKDKPDIVIGYENSCLETFKVARKMGICSVLDLGSVHDDQNIFLYNTFPSYRKIIKSETHFYKNHELKLQEYEAADYIFVLSTYAKDTCIKAGIDEKKLRVLNLGISTARFNAKKQYPTAKATLDLLFVGRITELKGIRLIFEALKGINDQNIKITLAGPVLDKTFMDAIDYPYIYKGHLSHEDLVKCYQEADVFISPSYTDSWAQTVIEAMACGTPVIVSDNTGARDAVAQGGGYVVPTGDTKALEEKIMYFFQHRDELKTMGRKAAAIAATYTWDHYHEQLAMAIADIARLERIG